MSDPDVTAGGTGRANRADHADRAEHVVERARALLADGNPVPGDAFGASWSEPYWQAELEQILASPRPQDTAAPASARRRRFPSRAWPTRWRPGGWGPGGWPHSGLWHGRRRWAGLGAICAVAAVAAVTVFAVAGPQQVAPSQVAELGVFRLPTGIPGANPGGSGAARNVLLAVANTVAHRPAPKAGAYWRGSAEFGNFEEAGSPLGERYMIVERGRETSWEARHSSGTSQITQWEIGQWLGVQLASPADAARWRRAGSPTTWNAPPDAGPADPQGFTDANGGSTRAVPGRPTVESGSSGPSSLIYDGKPLTALPADPAVLRKLLESDYRLAGEGGGVSAYLFLNAQGLLTEPVTQTVRSAVYQMLADLPGAVNLGTVRDVNGQSGTGIALDARYPRCLDNTGLANETLPNIPTAACTVQQRLIINPSTGLPLAYELRYVSPPDGEHWPVPGGLFSYEIFGASGWTNQASPPR